MTKNSKVLRYHPYRLPDTHEVAIRRRILIKYHQKIRLIRGPCMIPTILNMQTLEYMTLSDDLLMKVVDFVSCAILPSNRKFKLCILARFSCLAVLRKSRRFHPYKRPENYKTQIEEVTVPTEIIKASLAELGNMEQMKRLTAEISQNSFARQETQPTLRDDITTHDKSQKNKIVAALSSNDTSSPANDIHFDKENCSSEENCRKPLLTVNGEKQAEDKGNASTIDPCSSSQSKSENAVSIEILSLSEIVGQVVDAIEDSAINSQLNNVDNDTRQPGDVAIDITHPNKGNELREAPNSMDNSSLKFKLYILARLPCLAVLRKSRRFHPYKRPENYKTQSEEITVPTEIIKASLAELGNMEQMKRLTAEISQNSSARQEIPPTLRDDITTHDKSQKDKIVAVLSSNDIGSPAYEVPYTKDNCSFEEDCRKPLLTDDGEKQAEDQGNVSSKLHCSSSHSKIENALSLEIVGHVLDTIVDSAINSQLNNVRNDARQPSEVDNDITHPKKDHDARKIQNSCLMPENDDSDSEIDSETEEALLRIGSDESDCEVPLSETTICRLLEIDPPDKQVKKTMPCQNISTLNIKDGDETRAEVATSGHDIQLDEPNSHLDANCEQLSSTEMDDKHISEKEGNDKPAITDETMTVYDSLTSPSSYYPVADDTKNAQSDIQTSKRVNVAIQSLLENKVVLNTGKASSAYEVSLLGPTEADIEPCFQETTNSLSGTDEKAKTSTVSKAEKDPQQPLLQEITNLCNHKEFSATTIDLSKIINDEKQPTVTKVDRDVKQAESSEIKMDEDKKDIPAETEIVVTKQTIPVELIPQVTKLAKPEVSKQKVTELARSKENKPNINKFAVPTKQQNTKQAKPKETKSDATKWLNPKEMTSDEIKKEKPKDGTSNSISQAKPKEDKPDVIKQAMPKQTKPVVTSQTKSKESKPYVIVQVKETKPGVAEKAKPKEARPDVIKQVKPKETKTGVANKAKPKERTTIFTEQKKPEESKIDFTKQAKSKHDDFKRTVVQKNELRENKPESIKPAKTTELSTKVAKINNDKIKTKSASFVHVKESLDLREKLRKKKNDTKEGQTFQSRESETDINNNLDDKDVFEICLATKNKSLAFDGHKNITVKREVCLTSKQKTNDDPGGSNTRLQSVSNNSFQIVKDCSEQEDKCTKNVTKPKLETNPVKYEGYKASDARSVTLKQEVKPALRKAGGDPESLALKPKLRQVPETLEVDNRISYRKVLPPKPKYKPGLKSLVDRNRPSDRNPKCVDTPVPIEIEENKKPNVESETMIQKPKFDPVPTDFGEKSKPGEKLIDLTSKPYCKPVPNRLEENKPSMWNEDSALKPKLKPVLKAYGEEKKPRMELIALIPKAKHKSPQIEFGENNKPCKKDAIVASKPKFKPVPITFGEEMKPTMGQDDKVLKSKIKTVPVKFGNYNKPCVNGEAVAPKPKFKPVPIKFDVEKKPTIDKYNLSKKSKYKTYVMKVEEKNKTCVKTEASVPKPKFKPTPIIFGEETKPSIDQGALVPKPKYKSFPIKMGADNKSGEMAEAKATKPKFKPVPITFDEDRHKKMDKFSEEKCVEFRKRRFASCLDQDDSRPRKLIVRY